MSAQVSAGIGLDALHALGNMYLDELRCREVELIDVRNRFELNLSIDQGGSRPQSLSKQSTAQQAAAADDGA
jgi:hypothetical protein